VPEIEAAAEHQLTVSKARMRGCPSPNPNIAMRRSIPIRAVGTTSADLTKGLIFLLSKSNIFLIALREVPDDAMGD